MMDEIELRLAALELVMIELEGDRRRQPATDRPLAQQSGREFTSAVPTKTTGDELLSEDENTPEVQLCPRLRPQSFQPGA